MNSSENSVTAGESLVEAPRVFSPTTPTGFVPLLFPPSLALPSVEEKSNSGAATPPKRIDLKTLLFDSTPSTDAGVVCAFGQSALRCFGVKLIVSAVIPSSMETPPVMLLLIDACGKAY